MPKPGKYYVKAAEKNGLRVENGKGSHVKVYGPAGRGFTVVPLHQELANGTECAVRKWFKALGIVVVIVLTFAVFGGLL